MKYLRLLYGVGSYGTTVSPITLQYPRSNTKTIVNIPRIYLPKIYFTRTKSLASYFDDKPKLYQEMYHHV